MYDPQPLKGRFPCRGASDADAGSTWNAEVSAFLAQRFEGFVDIVIPAFVTGYLLFFAIGGFLHVSAILLHHCQHRTLYCSVPSMLGLVCSQIPLPLAPSIARGIVFSEQGVDPALPKVVVCLQVCEQASSSKKSTTFTMALSTMCKSFRPPIPQGLFHEVVHQPALGA